MTTTGDMQRNDHGIGTTVAPTLPGAPTPAVAFVS